MENKNSTTNFQNGNQSKEESTNAPLQTSQLMNFIENELMELYWAEKAETKAIPKMNKNSTTPELIDALTSHSAETGKRLPNWKRFLNQ